MMRKLIAAGNWKMNTSPEEGVRLASQLNEKVKGAQGIKAQVMIAPPFTHLAEINKVIDSDCIILAAQNCSSESKGAFTGEVSVDMLKAVGCKAIIIGHSERRSYFKEDKDVLFRKVRLTLDAGLTPVFCIGERLEERKSENHFSIVKQQIEEVLFRLNVADFQKVVIAYEPVWAIGTGVTASPEQAQEMHHFIRTQVAQQYDATVADATSILYGGSCNAKNAKELFANADVDGGLVGGASLEVDGFFTIIQSF